MPASANKRILLQAEPFGFGPAAAIATIAPLLAAQGVEIGYIGSGHTHDLQSTAHYTDYYDLTATHKPQTLWTQAAKKYPIFLTAMDFAAAEQAYALGMRVILYDALTWYWPTLPKIIQKCDLYLAQNFFGVEKRLTNIQKYTDTQVVPPLVSIPVPKPRETFVLLSLGGLQNPGWSLTEACIYAQRMITATRQALPDEQLVVTTSAAIAKALADTTVITAKAATMRQLLSRARLAIMTPGLGNIYDAAAHNLPTIWVPPANDSQGQQLTMLQTGGYVDGAIDWSDLGIPITYTKNQTQVLAAISTAVKTLHTNVSLQKQLHYYLRTQAQQLTGRTTSITRTLLNHFGTNGAEALIAKVITRL